MNILVATVPANHNARNSNARLCTKKFKQHSTLNFVLSVQDFARTIVHPMDMPTPSMGFVDEEFDDDVVNFVGNLMLLVISTTAMVYASRKRRREEPQEVKSDGRIGRTWQQRKRGQVKKTDYAWWRLINHPDVSDPTTSTAKVGLTTSSLDEFVFVWPYADVFVLAHLALVFYACYVAIRFVLLRCIFDISFTILVVHCSLFILNVCAYCITTFGFDVVLNWPTYRLLCCAKSSTLCIISFDLLYAIVFASFCMLLSTL